MNAKFYYCKRDERYIFKIKESDQTNTDAAYIEILQPTSITHPQIKVATGRLGKKTNYVYIAELERFYYIRNWTMENGYSILDCEVDVLMTYRRQLMNSGVVVKRNEFKRNNYLNDEKLVVNAPTRVKTIEFPTGFDKTKQVFYLAMISGQGAE